MTKEEMEKQIHQFAEMMYRTGYEDGQKDWHNVDEEREKAYKQGLNDVWDCARKVMLVSCDGGLSLGEHTEIFGSKFPAEILNNLTASEVIAKIKKYEEKHKCKECKWDEFRDAQSPVGTPCDSCFEGKNFSPKVARCCSILDDICPYDIKCEECEVHCSVERAKQKLKGDKE